MSKGVALVLSLLLFASMPVRAEVRLSAAFGDNMVLQRGVHAPVWGQATPGVQVTVSVAGATAQATADAEGRWQAAVGPLEAGGPYAMTVSAGGDTVAVQNVLVGDVWLCSGQSNMEWPLRQARDGAAETAAAGWPRIRLLTVARRASQEPLHTMQGRWTECSPQTAGGFSAVGYFFGRDLLRDLDVPIGLIDSSWGGTPAEAWTSRETLEANAELRPIVERFEKDVADWPARQADYQKRLAEWEAATYFAEPPNEGFVRGWAGADFDDSQWAQMDVPGAWEAAGLSIDGIVWFRRAVEIPAGWAGKDLTLSLGAIDDADVTYFDGTQVGATGLDTPNSYQALRRYTVPGRLVKPGRVVIAVRVYDHYGAGGFTGAPAAMLLAPRGDANGLSLAGPWRYALGDHRQQPAQYPPRPGMPNGPESPYSPAGLYNGMICPLIPMAIKGVIWYQGEANAGRAEQYRTLFPAMIECWRQAWGEDDFPFLFVQLPNFQAAQQNPVEAQTWPELREAQLAALKLPNTGVAVTIDVGEADNIHPRNKQDVGRRLALAALGIAYGRDVVYSGPMFDSMRIEDGSIALRFAHVGSGLCTCDGGPLKGFAVAGEDRVFHWAEARIEGDTVTVSSGDVQKPVAVRYGWADNPICNLQNREGLQASPFRTDDWPGVTAGRR